jgi:hypothetical protein
MHHPAEYMKIFLSKSLRGYLLTANDLGSTAGHWLSISSKYGLEEQVDTCINVMVEQLCIPGWEALSSYGVQAAVHMHRLAQAVCAAAVVRDTSARQVQGELGTLKRRFEGAAQRAGPGSGIPYCNVGCSCGLARYMLPTGNRAAPFCMQCGSKF